MTKKPMKQRGLGRGLSALMADVTDDATPTSDATSSRPDLLVPIEKVSANPDQPRRIFDKDQLEDLAASIAEKGIIQPLIVRARPGRAGRVRNCCRGTTVARGANGEAARNPGIGS